MSDLSREYKPRIMGVPMATQLVIAPIDRDNFTAAIATMTGSYSVRITRQDLHDLHNQINAALCTDGPLHTDV